MRPFNLPFVPLYIEWDDAMPELPVEPQNRRSNRMRTRMRRLVQREEPVEALIKGNKRVN